MSHSEDESSPSSSPKYSPPPSYLKDVKYPLNGHVLETTAPVDLHSFSGFMRPRMSLVESTSSNLVMATLELPGMKKADIIITASGGRLIIAGERIPPSSFADRCCHSFVDELKYGKFIRVIMLPIGIEATQVTASMEDGMLTVCWPRTSSHLKHEPQRVIVA